MPYERAVLFLNEGMKRLNEYWERVDHHRINKYKPVVEVFVDGRVESGGNEGGSEIRVRGGGKGVE
jgi:hypothetical protein